MVYMIYVTFSGLAHYFFHGFFYQTLLMDIIEGKRVTPLSSGYFSLSMKDKQGIKTISFRSSLQYFAESDVSHSYA